MREHISEKYAPEFVYWHRVTYDNGFQARSDLNIPHHLCKAHGEISGPISLLTASEVRQWRPRPQAKPSHDMEKAFVVFERARQMLSKQRVRDARELLQRGATRYPDDEQISDLLRAVSPGRVSRTEGPARNRTREMAWIREKGHRYRNQWVAIRGEKLIAHANSLSDLLERVKELNGKHESPIIQKIAPVSGDAC